jgi:hypothetical protein
MARSRNWCFTLNNPTEEDPALLEARVGADVSYICWGREVGENATPHLQGYTEFGRPTSLRSAKRYLDNDRMHLEARRGTQTQAVEYCQKDGAFVEFGEKKAQGRRTDLDRLADVVAAVRAPEHVAHELPGMYIRYHKGIAELHRALRANPAWPGARDGSEDVVCTYVHGRTGVGKSRRVWELAGDPDDVYLKTAASGKWWDGYVGQPTVILDEFRGELPFGELLQIIDRYRYRVEYKGGSTMLCALRFFIISDRRPDEMYLGVTATRREQFMRRINDVVHIE